ncbi:MAG: hypothetical protein C4321_10710 [Chloroflexota bacterium]
MPINSVVNTLATSATSGASDFPSTEMGRQDFLQLLTLQLRNQDPLDPVDNREFIAQMAQLSALEATTKLSGQMQNMVLAQQQTQAVQMVGRDVKYLDSEGQSQQGKVSGVRLDSAPPLLVINDKEVPITWVQTVL